MPAYVIIDIESTDEERAAAYRALSGPSVQTHGGHFVARGGATRVLEGDWDPARLVVIAFPTVDAAQAWYDSDEYRAARDVRAGAGTWRIVAVAGLD